MKPFIRNTDFSVLLNNNRTLQIIILLSIFSITFTSCAIYSAKNYNTYYLNLNRTIQGKFKSTKQLSSYDYTNNNITYFRENGYVMIGYDALRSTYIGYQQAVNAGCWVGATVMLYKHTYVGTASGTAVMPFYNSGDTYTLNSRTSGSINTNSSTSASVYGSDGYAYGNSYSSGYGTYNSNTTTTITTPGTFSYYTVPYSNNYYDQYAIYFVKKYYRIEHDLILFQKANALSKQLGTVKKNVWFEIVSKGNAFIKINLQGTVGYISSYYPLK